MGKSSSQTIGYWYNVAYHAGLGIGPIDAFLEFRGGDKTAWAGNLTASGTLSINAPNLWGGEKDQGGIQGDVDVLFGEATQVPNAYLQQAFGAQVPAWRGLATLVFKGGRYGAMNPYPQKPAYKIQRIVKGWDGDACWYPEKASITMGTGHASTTDGYFLVQAGEDILNVAGGVTTVYGTVPNTFVGTAHQIAQLCLDTRNATDGSTFHLKEAFVSAQGDKFIIGSTSIENGNNFGIAGVRVQPTCPLGYATSFEEHGSGSTLGVTEPTVVCTINYGFFAMNPAHILYYARTQQDMGREPTANMSDASFRAAADWYAAQGFGLCTEYDPASESLDDFITRIEKVAGCSMSRSPVDGLWYLDVANGVYDLATLPILGDDDILDFSVSPNLQDSATNSVSVQYFDPQQKETISTAPVQAMALVDAFGTIHDQVAYAEVPTSDLALRLATRNLRAAVTPARAFTLTTTRLTYGWRVGTYFRLQSPKRGIVDMVCILAEKSSGTLKSGAIKLTASQDIYSLPTASFVDAEHGVDTRPSQIPMPITLQQAFEAPYVVVATSLSRADLAVLPDDVGYLLAVAADPAASRDFTLMVSAAGGAYAPTANGDWCATASVVEASGFDDTAFTLAGGVGLANIATGMPALWGSEIVRVDAIDASTGAVTLGRGCADTVPVKHAAGERLWFYATAQAADRTEYTDGEVINAKLLTNTGSQQLDPAVATALPVTFASRAARPYPPGQLRINGIVDPSAIVGAITVSGVHRDRVLQADQLVDSTMATVGPEAGTTYTVRYYLNDALLHTDSGLSAPSSTYTPSGAGILRVEVESVRDGLTSTQMHIRQFTIGQPLLDETGATITTEDNQLIIMG